MRAVRFPVATAGLVVLAIAAIGLSTALARPTIRQSFFNAYPVAVGSRLDNLPSHSTHCGVCHYDFDGGGFRNPYGVKLGQTLGSFANNDAGRQAAMHSIESLDSDGDGYTTLAEITDAANYANTPTFPGLNATNYASAVNVPNLTEIESYLTPVAAGDVQAPVVTVVTPNGGASWLAGIGHLVTWSATDNVGVTAVDVEWRESEAAGWLPLARDLANTGSFTWFVPNLPTSGARVRVVARDLAGNAGRDSSDAVFGVTAIPGGIAPTTLRDFDQPGTQPFGGGSFATSDNCVGCHGGYDAAVEPGHNARGSMMMQAGRDPLFYACLAVAEQDAPSSGDLCLRCHTPFGWLEGRSQPTGGAQITGGDRDGVSCDLCHRMTDPLYSAGVSPAEDLAVLAGLLPGHTPTNVANGQFVVDPVARKRGPLAAPFCPHPFLGSPFHQESDLCGTCHDVSNPVFQRVGDADYAVGPLDQAAASMGSDALMPLERTYSEWKHSAYPAGVYAPDFAGNKPGGVVSSCQDCHMRSVTGTACNDPGAPVRTDLPLHDLTGGNTWMPGVVATLHPGEVDVAALGGSAARARSMLEKAALLGVDVASEADSFRATVTVTNRSGHKLPTGYPEGRRMWLHIVARDAQGAVVWESGAWDPATGTLDLEPAPAVWEAHLGVSPALGAALGIAHGPTFHFALNDSIYKDNRIPPQGFTNAAFATFGGAPVDPEAPGTRYADGQYWDAPSFGLPASARSVRATLYYQSTSREYVEFLRDENTTNAAGQQMHDAWAANGRAAPVAMASDSATLIPVAADPPAAPSGVALAVLANPFRDALEVRLDLPRPARVALRVVDLQGRTVARVPYGARGPGSHWLVWNARDARGDDPGAGTFWLAVDVDGATIVRRVVRLR